MGRILAAEFQKATRTHVENLLGNGDWDYVKVISDWQKGENDVERNISYRITAEALCQDNTDFRNIQETVGVSLFRQFIEGFEDMLYNFDPDEKQYLISTPSTVALCRNETGEVYFVTRWCYRELPVLQANLTQLAKFHHSYLPPI
jgi:hypothetical protein